MLKAPQPSDTPLMKAVREKDITIIAELLVGQIDRAERLNEDPKARLKNFINEQDTKNGNTALHLIAQSTDSKALGIAKLLIEAGADLTLQNKGGRTVKDLAIREGRTKLVNLLESYRNTMPSSYTPLDILKSELNIIIASNTHI